jgi:hypothetical protein
MVDIDSLFMLKRRRGKTSAKVQEALCSIQKKNCVRIVASRAMQN